ncbi:hypothetical protein QUF80_19160 [Desulfococcaceae bacterium HSG8]|nr:hypothetical protein [Desulfococcaceae bacterium HSG8]
MSFLSMLIILKVVITGLVVVLPFLFLPKSKLEKTTTFFRLYGVAILALLVGYCFGIKSAENNQFPWGVVCMGAVSNGGAALLLLLSRSGKQNLILGTFFALVTLGLVTAMVVPEAALQKIW